MTKNQETLYSKEAIDTLSGILDAQDGRTIFLSGAVSSSFFVYASALIKKRGGHHIIVADDYDSAAYALNDFYALLGEENVFFFPSSFRESVHRDKLSQQNIVMRTSSLEALKQPSALLVTYPEALMEKIPSVKSMESSSLVLSVGSELSPLELEQRVVKMGFTKVDFVYEPGQYSMRGGIFDIFSFSESKPFRVDFFGDEIDSIRRFDISNQLSSDKVDSMTVIGDITEQQISLISLVQYSNSGTFWFTDALFCMGKINDVLGAMSDSKEECCYENRMTSSQEIIHDLENHSVVLLRNNFPHRAAERTLPLKTTPQTPFGKKFELLADDVISYIERGYKCFFVSENYAQKERLDNIFEQTGKRYAQLEMLRMTLHEGYIDHLSKVCLYVDHQIFGRYHRYRLAGEIRRSEQMTIEELNTLHVGDYVVHINHGIGRFGGLVKVSVGEKQKEAIKLIYKDGDVLMVDIHALHLISKYKRGDSEEAPKLYKLGGGAWQKLKNATKKAVKDISKELIELYAKRKASRGYAFQADSYLQQELEASFEWEDTPDQKLATDAVKKDMESVMPMNRLLCGDVGFGKTEIAIRAAFKAAVDGKQTAVLVPTTILALQHYRSFRERLSQMPVTVEYLNRTKSQKEVKDILERLKAGKIDIIIGTHKLLSKNVEFHDLGLLIIDEEHRFGVSAKEQLTKIAVNVDTLTLTATPIPRTLQFSLMGSRDLSIISTPPPNRRPIVTESHIFSEEIVRDAIRNELSRHGQIYYIHNNVDELPRQAEMLNRIVPEARLGIIHGRMKPQEVEKCIMDFIYGESDILLATSILESGIDIANVNTIIINNADRFGLSSLHQLRGRVGRSNRKAFCYLLTKSDELLSSDARRRLRAIEEFSELGSGFNIAMQDMDIRGAGNLLGAEQSGFIADIGFETYQKILAEAMAELRQEGYDSDMNLNNVESKNMDQGYTSDVQIELGVEAELPETYIRQQAERLKLYRELDSIRDEESLEKFRLMLVDRFGKLPPPAGELLDVMRLKWECMRLGVERVKVKNSMMILVFISNVESAFYRSATFQGILQTVVSRPEKFVLKSREDRVQITVRNVPSVRDGVNVLKEFHSIQSV
ncbi:MAG: transcription-repair coupling factor [Alistipes sp.]|nr:transcription-repair coupling factor [Candidatus Alistipes equi]